MRQFFNILNFEFSSYLKNKTFVGITVALIVVMGALLSFPRLEGLLSKTEEAPVESTEKSVVLVSDSREADGDTLLSLLAAKMPENEFVRTDKTVAELTAIVGTPECESAIVILSPTTYTYIVQDIGMTDNTRYNLEEVMTESYRIASLARLGASAGQVSDILNQSIEGEIIKTGKDQIMNFFYTYILIFALYMAILLYGQFVATSVASEKSSRAMELLITSAKPSSLMFGKVFGAGFAGLLQLSAILASTFIFFNINKSYWQDNAIVTSIFDMPLPILLYTILFFVLGFFIYAFLYGAIGSLASNVEDINTSSLPITFLFIAAFMVVMFSMSSGNVDSGLMVAASYIPFTSPMAMFVRIAMGNVSGVEIAISVAILLVSTIGIGAISAKIYRIGVLLYGTPPKLSNIIKNLNR